MFSNAVFSDEGLLKLNSLNAELVKLSEKKYAEGENSPYSQNMILTGIKIIELLLNNNSIKHWSNEKNTAALTKLFDALDGEKGTFVPEVFNTQSYELAQLLLQNLQKTQLQDILNVMAGMALNNLINPASMLEVMINNIKYKIQLYEMFKNNELETIKMKTISSDISEYYIKLEDKNNLINLNKKDYETQCLQIIKRINETPYLRICNAISYINSNEPLKLRPEDLVTAGNRMRLIKELLISETFLNETLIKAHYRLSLPLMTLI